MFSINRVFKARRGAGIVPLSENGTESSRVTGGRRLGVRRWWAGAVAVVMVAGFGMFAGVPAASALAPAGTPDLVVSITDSSDPTEFIPSESNPAGVSYFITVRNTGTADATNVTLRYSTFGPVYVQGLVPVNYDWEANADETGEYWTIPSIPAGSSSELIYYLNGIGPGVFGLTVTVSDDNGDLNLADNTDTEYTNAPPAGADVGVSVADSADPVALGASFTYTATVTNSSANPASGVSVQTVISGAATIDSASGPGGPCAVSSGTVTCAIGALAGSASATVTIGVTPSATGTVSAASTVTATETDPAPANNTDSESTTVNNALGCTIVGTPGNDTLNGTNGNDVICGLGGNDTINGGNGNDILYGGPGDDAMSGGNGADQLYAGAGNDTVNGETSVGSLLSTFDNGDDIINGGSGNDVLNGGNGDDIITDTQGTDTLNGGNGNDTINVHDGTGGDTANGGLGADSCTSDTGDTASSC